MLRSLAPLAACALLALACGNTPSNPDGGAGGGTGTGGGMGTGGGGAGGGSGGGASGGGTGGGSASGPTWYKDVLPIVQAKCQKCHLPGGIGPFALDSYATAKPLSASMADAVANRRMPPWMPSATCGGPFEGDRSLGQQDIDTIVAWHAAGALEGNAADAPPAPDAGVPGLPRVDATLTMPEPYTPSATLTDDYRCFLVDPQLTSVKQVTGYNIKPGVHAEVHHVIVYVVDMAAAQQKDAAEAGPGWTCFGGPGVNSDGAIGAWAPGMPAVTFPAGTGIPLQTGKGLAIQIHYNTSAGTRVPDQTAVELSYAQGFVTLGYLVPLVANGFAIPPMSTGYTFNKSFPNSYGVPLKVYGYLPHMHTLGKQIRISGAANECLIDIPRWDFHWQQQYFTATPYTLPSGQALNLECSWDNPTQSTVRWGEGTADEMCFAYVYATL